MTQNSWKRWRVGARSRQARLPRRRQLEVSLSPSRARRCGMPPETPRNRSALRLLRHSRRRAKTVRFARASGSSRFLWFRRRPAWGAALAWVVETNFKQRGSEPKLDVPLWRAAARRHGRRWWAGGRVFSDRHVACTIRSAAPSAATRSLGPAEAFLDARSNNVRMANKRELARIRGFSASVVANLDWS